MTKNITVFVAVLLFNFCFSQNAELKGIDKQNQEIGKELLKFLKIIPSEENVVIYIIGARVAVITQENNGFHLQRITIKDSSGKMELLKDDCVFQKTNELLDNAFSLSLRKEIIFSEDKYFGSSYVYFLLSKKGETIVEFNLPGITYELGPREFKYPISKKLQGFLTSWVMKLDGNGTD